MAENQQEEPLIENEVEVGPMPSLFDGSLSIRDAIAYLRMRLLDLTARNRLLNFKPSAGKTIQIVNVVPDAIWEKLLDGGALTIIPIQEPSLMEYNITEEGRKVKPDAKDYARKLGIDTSYDLSSTLQNGSSGKIQALYYPEDLARFSRKVFGNAKSAIEETGTNMLYLVFGFLEFYEDDSSTKPLLAPLLAVPVTIKPNGIDANTRHPKYELNFTNEEVTDNLSLREKLKQQYSIQLPEYDEQTPDQYFTEVAKFTETKPKWRVRRQVVLSMLSFAKMVLVNDLDPSNWPTVEGKNGLLDHDLVKTIFEGVDDEWFDSDSDSDFDLDDHPDNGLPLIYDADNYQHKALIEALNGKNLVINGPPGTGKSQTITNLIACAMQRGLKVLFISEKLAALQVVQNRLQQAGLGKFVLELHSNKTNKKKFLEELAETMQATFTMPTELPSKVQALESRRKELKKYADTLNSKVGNRLGLTVYEVMWRAERHRQECGDEANSLENVFVENVSVAIQEDLDAQSDAIKSLALHFEAMDELEYGAWYGFFPENLAPDDFIAIQNLLTKLITGTYDIDKALEELKALLPAELSLEGRTRPKTILIGLQSFPPIPENLEPDLLPRLFKQDDPKGYNSKVAIDNLKNLLAKYVSLVASIESKLKKVDGVNVDSVSTAEKAIATLKKYQLHEKSVASVRRLSEQTFTSIDKVGLHIDFFKQCVESINISFTGTSENLIAISTLIEIAHSVPYDLLGYRKPSLDSPDAKRILDKANSHYSECLKMEQHLDSIFYMDETVDEGELSKVIHTFREGDAWYRFFQSNWRRAKQFYRTHAKNKEKLSVPAMLDNLEAFQKYKKHLSQFLTSTEYKNTFGDLFLGKETDFSKLQTLIEWYSTSKRLMFEKAIPPETFDLTTTPPLLVAKLAKLHPDCKKRTEALLPHSKFLQSLTLNIGVGKLDSYTELEEVLKTVFNEIELYMTPLETYGNTSLDASSILQGLKQKLECDKIYSQIELCPARQILADHFHGTQTSLESIHATLSWGQAVAEICLRDASLGLPISIKVLQSNAVEIIPKLMQKLNEASNQWDKVQAFADNMGKFGRFNWRQWQENTPLAEIETPETIRLRTQIALDAMNALLPWSQYLGSKTKVVSIGLDAFVDKLEDGKVESKRLLNGFLYRFFYSIAQSIFQARPELTQFSTVRHNQLRNEFSKLDREVISLRGKECAYQISNKKQLVQGGRGNGSVEQYTECELLNRLIPQTKPRVPIRQILNRAGKSIQTLKPCFMMSPLAVAQYLKHETLSFDLIVMDEASQLTPEESIGVIARGKQLIVVGDPKQLPPTNFFNRVSTVSDGDDSFEDLMQESILDACYGKMPERMLQLHYRSRHESLIAYSNANFYKGKLVVFPSPYPRSRHLGLQYNFISNGVYNNRQNQPEAMRVVDAVLDFMRNSTGDSLGVVSLNITQRDLIEELLEIRLQNHPECQEFRVRQEEKGEPLFIKNLENVQGDERDVIFISTTFGKAPGTSVVRQNFGPISRGNGGRRLNVLFTRARKSVQVFTSMQPSDIVIDQNSQEGTRHFRGYLEYAKNGYISNVIDSTGREPDSDFEVAVADMLTSKGYEIQPQVGVAGYFIDLAVRSPKRRNEYLVAVECDGASYHSGTSVRDRDRIRQEILEGLGWKGKVWRIWSTDWFRNPHKELARLIEFIKQKEAEVEREPAPYYDEVDIEEQEAEAKVDEFKEDVTLRELVESYAKDEESVYVMLGDKVTYFEMGHPEAIKTIRIIGDEEEVNTGEVVESKPLAQALLNAEQGDECELFVIGHPVKLLKIVKIERI